MSPPSESSVSPPSESSVPSPSESSVPSLSEPSVPSPSEPSVPSPSEPSRQMTNNRFGKEAWELFRSGYSVSIIAIVPFMLRTYVVLHLLHSHFDFSVEFLYLLIWICICSIIISY